mgnify:CR=1 FL=1
MSNFAQKVREYYVLGLWDERKVRDAVAKGKVSESEFRVITGKEF